MRQFEALVLTAGKRVERLPQPQMPQAYIHQHLEPRRNAAGAGILLMRKETLRRGNIQRQHFGHVVTQQGDRKSLLGIARAVAQGAGHKDIRKELHFHFFLPQAATARAAALAAVEGEIPGLESPCLRRRFGHKQGADILKHPDIHRRGTARRAHNGALIHQHHFFHLIQPGNVAHLHLVLIVQFPGVLRAVQHLAGQRALAAAGNTREAVIHAQRNLHGEIMQVVALCPLDAEAAFPLAAARRHRDAAPTAQILPGEGAGIMQNPLRITGIHQFTAGSTTPGPHINEVISRAHHGFLMLHHHQRIPAVRQPPHGGNQPHGVAGMQPHRRFIQHKKCFRERRPQAGGEAYALNLTAGERTRQAAGGNIPQPHLAEIGHAAAEFLHRLLQRAVCPGVPEHMLIQPGQQLIHRQRLHLRHGKTADGESLGLRTQTPAVALRAHAVHAVERQEHAHAHLVRMLFHIVKNPLVTVPQSAVVCLPHIQLPGFAVEHPVAFLLRQLTPRHIHAHRVAALVCPHQVLVAGRKRG